MSGYAKLSSTLVLSTVWSEPHTVRIVWITMLALADAGGYVGASLPGLADAARVTLEECQQALACFQRPDPYSRSKTHDGRRIEEVAGGWRLLNYGTYRAGRDPETRRRQNREAQARHRDAQPVSHSQPQSAADKPESAQAEAEAEAEAEADQDTTASAVVGAAAPPKPRKRRWRRVPTGWEPNDGHRALAIKLGVSFDTELAKYRDHDYGTPKTDPDATFRNWLRNAKPVRSIGADGRRAGDLLERQSARYAQAEADERRALP